MNIPGTLEDIVAMKYVKLWYIRLLYSRRNTFRSSWKISTINKLEENRCKSLPADWTWIMTALIAMKFNSPFLDWIDLWSVPSWPNTKMSMMEVNKVVIILIVLVAFSLEMFLNALCINKQYCVQNPGVYVFSSSDLMGLASGCTESESHFSSPFSYLEYISSIFAL